MKPKTQLIVALDTDSLKQAKQTVDTLSSLVSYFKVGSQLFTACGPAAVKMIKDAGGSVFLDLKFHDIPNTVAKAALSVLELGVSMFNVHALGGKIMLTEMVKAVDKEFRNSKAKRPLILGVTILTSFNRQQLNSIGIMRSVKNEVAYLARLCKGCGLDGVVCSGHELELLRRVTGKNFVLVVPGVRPKKSESFDQKRIVTPEEAVRLGADFIVVGRPITASSDPLKSAQDIINQLN